MLQKLLLCVVPVFVACGERHAVVGDGGFDDLQQPDGVALDLAQLELSVDTAAQDGPVQASLDCPPSGASTYRVALRWDDATETLSPEDCLAVEMTIGGTKAPPFPSVLGTHAGTWYELLDDSGTILYQNQALVFGVLCPLQGYAAPNVLAYLDIPNHPEGETFRFIDHECGQLAKVLGQFSVH